MPGLLHLIMSLLIGLTATSHPVQTLRLPQMPDEAGIPCWGLVSEL